MTSTDAYACVLSVCVCGMACMMMVTWLVVFALLLSSHTLHGQESSNSHTAKIDRLSLETLEALETLWRFSPEALSRDSLETPSTFARNDDARRLKKNDALCVVEAVVSMRALVGERFSNGCCF